MKIAPDKLMHLKLGVLLALLLAGVLVTAHRYGPGWAMALGAILLAAGVEAYQKLRGEGMPSLADAAASAAPGVLAGLAFEAWRLQQ